MKQKMKTAFVVVLSLFLFGDLAIAQNGQGNAPVPMMQKMQMCKGIMGNQQYPHAKPGMMKGGMMGAMGVSSMMHMGDPLFKELHGYGCPGFVLKFSGQLSLSSDQIKKLQVLKMEFKKLAIQNQANLQVATIDLKEILNAKNPNFKKAQAKLNQITLLQGKLRTAFLNTIQSGRQVLTPDQLQKFKGLSVQPPMQKCKGGMM